MRELRFEELSASELDTVSAGWRITLGDIIDAGEWVYHHVIKR